jgi:hypothetical protein
MGPEAADFLAAVAKSPELWRSIDVRVLAVRHENDWHNVATRCYLDPRDPRDVVRLPDLPVTEHAGSWQEVLPSSALLGVIEGVEGGKLAVGGEIVKYLAPMAHPSAQLYSFNRYSLIDLSERLYAPYRYWSAHSVGATGNSTWDLLQKVPGGRHTVDNELRAHKAPFDGLSGVAQFAIGSPDPQTDQRLCLFEVFAPLEGLLVTERCSLRGGIIHFTLRAGSEAARRKLELGVFAVVAGDAVPYRTSLDLAGQDWTRDGPHYSLTSSIKVSRAQFATLILRMSGVAVHRLTLIDPLAGSGSVPLAAYRFFDADLHALTESLAQEGALDSSGFERAVARLFMLVGFHVDLLSGDKRLENAPDVMIFAPSTHICIAVECTTGSLDSKGKLGKLVARANALSGAVPGTEVWAVIVTALSRNQLSSGDLERAAADDLVVLAQEDLTELLLMASNGAAVSDVLGFLRSKIPGKPGSLQLPRPARGSSS